MKLLGTCIVACVVLAAACEHQRKSSYSRPGDDPHDTDSLYALYHQILSDSDPVTTWSETGCEMYRLMDKLGPDVATRRLHAFFDTVYTRAERRRRDEVDPKLWYHTFPLDNSSCAADFRDTYDPNIAIDSMHPRTQPVRKGQPPDSTGGAP